MTPRKRHREARSAVATRADSTNRRPYQAPRAAHDPQRNRHRRHVRPVPLPRLCRPARRLRPDRRRGRRRRHLHHPHHRLPHGPALQRHQRTRPARHPLFPPRRRVDDGRAHHPPADRAHPGHGRTFAQRPRACGGRVLHDLRRHLRLLHRRHCCDRNRADARHARGGLRARLLRRADRRRRLHRLDGAALHHGHRLWRGGRRLGRRPVPRRRRARPDGLHRPDDLQLLLRLSRPAQTSRHHGRVRPGASRRHPAADDSGYYYRLDPGRRDHPGRGRHGRGDVRPDRAAAAVESRATSAACRKTSRWRRSYTPFRSPP